MTITSLLLQSSLRYATLLLNEQTRKETELTTSEAITWSGISSHAIQHHRASMLHRKTSRGSPYSTLRRMRQT